MNFELCCKSLTIKPASEHKRRGTQIEGLHRFILDMIRREGSATTLGAAKALATAMRKRAGDALQKMRRQGKVSGERYGRGGELRWRLAG